MSCLAWNCRGLGAPRKVRTLGNLIRENSPQLVFLSETKLPARKIELIRRRFELHGVAVDSRGLSGGLALLWPKEMNVVLQSFSKNHIDVHVYDDDSNSSWRFTGFYGEPKDTDRHKSWQLLRRLASLSNKPWLCAGDFNAMLSTSEKSGGQIASFRNITDFADCLRDSELHDLGYSGYPFTWTNNWPHPHTVRERIDRACASYSWMGIFPNYRVVHLEALNSDHIPILIELKKKNVIGGSRRNRGFKFEAMWMKSEECAKIIEQHWLPDLLREDDLMGTLESCKVGLMTWNKQSFGGVTKLVKKLKEEVFVLKKGTLTADTKLLIKQKTNELEGLLDSEELMWRQRAKAHWMREGDKNTKFFHAKASSRRKGNTILGLRNNEGVWCEEENELEGIVADYFRDIFTSKNPTEDDLGAALEVIQQRISPEMNADFLKEFTTEEIKKALDSMHPLKSPGPDGFPVIFYQRFWHIVKNDVTRWVLQLLNHKVLPASCNFTYIVLIPKCPNPQSMAQFRPISLSNVVYKIASKSIVNRLKPFMNDIISESQSAFVPSRLISDNILIAYELAHYMKRSSAEHMAVKLDMSKAYDRIEWVFVQQVMLRLGMDSRFVELIMLCVTTVTYSFVLNGGSFGFLTPERGIRQGDPMSPYLFLFCAEVLSGLLRNEEEKGNIAGLSVCTGAPPVSHLLFADDTMIFCNANAISSETIRNVLKTYEDASGQQVNFQKSSIVFSKTTSDANIEIVRSFLPMEVVDKHDKYLGLPSVIGRSKREAFAHIRDKVCHRLKGWKEKWLSKGGKEILIKSVIQAIPSYAMSCFKLPSYFTKKIESLMSKFWWESSNGKGIHWARWSDMCQSKQFGGLGFRDLEAFNMALLAKQVWRLLESPDSLLGKIFKARYYPQSDVFGSRLGSNPSYTWRSIWGAKEIIEKGSRWRVGNGNSINIWGDRWLPRESTFQIFTPKGDRPSDMKVSTLIDEETGQWDVDKVTSLFNEEDSACILSIPLGNGRHDDRRLWHYNRNGLFSVRSAYHLAVKIARESDHTGAASSSAGNSNDWKWLWALSIPSKIKIFLWRACKNLLPTRAVLTKRKITNICSCVICDGEVEDVLHCFFLCHLARQVWALSGISCSVYHSNVSNFRDWLEEIKGKTDSKTFELCTIICWSIWHARNKWLFEGIQNAAPSIVIFARNYQTTLWSNFATVLRPQRQVTNMSWKAPLAGFVKINFDAAVNSRVGRCGLGVVARSEHGICVGWRSVCIRQSLDPTAAEARAALLAVEFAKERNWSKVIVEGDSSVVVNAIGCSSESRADYGIIIEDIKHIASSFESFSIQHLRREGNRVAHELAQLSSVDSFALNVLPVWIQNIVLSDLSNE
ncbi:hypothetical protein ACJIZ3_021352 [Penstemon smallii]|uniref:Reverse transcriptase domain-containing protein n=1 Tax=Penstemon smallii TaxID=265156 RepID=A0ABD3SLC6_9LAMI